MPFSEALSLLKRVVEEDLMEREFKGYGIGMYIMVDMCKRMWVGKKHSRVHTQILSLLLCLSFPFSLSPTASLTHSLMVFLGEEIVVSNAHEKSWNKLSKARGDGEQGGWGNHKTALRQTFLSHLSFQLS